MSQNFTFKFKPDEIISEKYKIISLLGTGWEGEVYKIRELSTGIDRAAKFFYPKRNKRNNLLRWNAKKLHKLRHCSILIQYQTQDYLFIDDQKVTYLVSEFVDGLLLSQFLDQQPGKRLSAFQALHLLHSLAKGIQTIHHLKEYHGDLHTDNIIVCKYGLGFEFKLFDMYHWSMPKNINIQDDVSDLIRIFYDSLGGVRFYKKQPDAIKDICCGLKKSLIKNKFKTAGQLREYIEYIEL